ncbi:hypothetical protein CY34DRAFT_705396 [Suillus luteus UH-Slu-Lm8-n1]|uniref:Unplaced genomic scaffold CY34scaffold_8, whole genome shotgun sequence n=1 Tax=Suillus luteus UH-Slu-Lm8-n1 TaxID=930992 RepID=A0A0D0BRJ4_9AGAM|nr:hypothetical protein CY34DRAFT_705396 [Suillus luteus UH-Slu-Lm8-n1]
MQATLFSLRRSSRCGDYHCEFLLATVFPGDLPCDTSFLQHNTTLRATTAESLGSDTTRPASRSLSYCCRGHCVFLAQHRIFARGRTPPSQYESNHRGACV